MPRHNLTIFLCVIYSDILKKKSLLDEQSFSRGGKYYIYISVKVNEVILWGRMEERITLINEKKGSYFQIVTLSCMNILQ